MDFPNFDTENNEIQVENLGYSPFENHNEVSTNFNIPSYDNWPVQNSSDPFSNYQIV